MTLTEKLDRLPRWVWERTLSWLTHPRLGRRLALIAVLLSSSALLLGFYLDDYIGRYIYSDREGAARLFRNYSGGYGLGIGDPAENHWQMEAGWAPWWHYDTLRIALFRPIGVMLHAIDFRLWPDHPLVMHAHNLVWLALLVLAMTWMYRGVLGLALGGAAAVLFAFDHTHGFAVGHICNRHALLGPLLGALCLGFHIRARSLPDTTRVPRGLWLAPLFYVIGLLTSESAIAVAAYVVAYELCAAEGPLKRRAAAAAPYVLITMVWRALYTKAGFGAFGSGVYTDLGREPLRYLHVLLERGPLLWAGQFFTPPAELHGMLQEPASSYIYVWAWGVVLLTCCALAPLLARDRMARFWCLGMLASLVPAAAVIPHDRQLVFVSIGAMALLARLWQHYAEDAGSTSWPRRLAGYFGVLLLFVHLVPSPLSLPATTASVMLTQPLHDSLSTVGDEVAGRDLVFVTTPDFYTVRLVQLTKRLAGSPLPRRIRALSGVPAGAPKPLVITRDGERSLAVHFEDGLFSPPNSDLHRDRSLPMPAGTEVHLEGFDVKVLTATREGWPLDVSFTFDKALDDPSLAFYRWQGRGFVPFVPPAIGKSVTLPGAQLPTF